MATKEHRKYARGLIEGLESRVHLGPPVHHAEIHSARQFLLQHDFSPSSDYFNRLFQIQDRLKSRSQEPSLPPAKRNYGGEAAGYRMQVQSIYDHVILSTCYEGQFNGKSGRVKISHRFNQQGRIDFVEMKFLRSLEPFLNGEIRKMLLVKGYQDLQKGWWTAEAFVLAVLPRELIFLHQDIFRCAKSEILAWIVNIGHRISEGLVQELSLGKSDTSAISMREREQLCLEAVRADDVAWPILQKAAALESAVEVFDLKNIVVRYLSR